MPFIHIPNSVKLIESRAFHNCSGFKSISIPDSVTKIGPAAFQGCSSLQSIVIKGLITSVNNFTFKDCTACKSIVLPSSVTSCGYNAFKDCESLVSITIPDAALYKFDLDLYPPDYDTFCDNRDMDPFKGCTILQAAARSMNMTVSRHLLHQSERKRMLHLKYGVLICLKRINNARILTGEANRRFFRWGNDLDYDRNEKKEQQKGIDILTNMIDEAIGFAREDRRYLTWGNDPVDSDTAFIANMMRNRLELRSSWFDGVRAEEMITAFEMWREILTFL